MSDTPMDLFVALSAVLTGIDKSKLAPSLDPVNIKKTYLEYAQNKAVNEFPKLLDIYQRNQSLPAAQVGDIILNQSGDDICYLARSVMLMWYLGSWYDPTELKKYNGQHPPSDPVPAFAVISSDAYTRGWTWSVAQAHPMGYSNLQHGYWSTLPPSLQDFIGGGS